MSKLFHFIKSYNFKVWVFTIPLIFFFTQSFILFWFFVYFEKNEPGSFLVVVLFFIPIFLQFLGSVFIKDTTLNVFYSLLSCSASGSYLGSLLYYMYVPEASFASAITCIIVSIILVIMAFVITTATFNDGSNIFKHPRVEHLVSKIGTAPSGEILVFLAYFIAIGYLLAFAFAFHDRNLTSRGDFQGLIAEALPVKEIEKKEMFPVEKFFYFLPGSAESLYSDREPSLESYGTQRAVEDTVKYENYRTLDTILDFIKTSATKHSLLITLKSYTDDSRLALGNSSFSSNYELAQARANSVKTKLLDDLYKYDFPAVNNIEWQIVPLPTSRNQSPNIGVTKARAVGVLIQQSSNQSSGKESRFLRLIEYVYFSMYTITTTGYGDIKPSTPFAMFTCTLANLYEVFFMVVFFNVLISPKTRTRRKRNKSNKAITKPPS